MLTMDTSNKKTKKTSVNRTNMERPAFRTIRNAVSGLGKVLSTGADNVADIFLDENLKGLSAKTGKLKKECVHTFKGAAKGLKKDLEIIKANDIVLDTSYGLGRLFRITKDTCTEIVNDLIG